MLPFGAQPPRTAWHGDFHAIHKVVVKLEGNPVANSIGLNMNIRVSSLPSQILESSPSLMQVDPGTVWRYWKVQLPVEACPLAPELMEVNRVLHTNGPRLVVDVATSVVIPYGERSNEL